MLNLLSRVLTVIIAILAVAVAVAGLAGCDIETTRLQAEAEASRARAEAAQAEAAMIRAEGDAAVLKAQAYDLTARTQADARLLAMADRQGDLIDNTYWLNWLIGLLVVLVVIDIALHVAVVCGVRISLAGQDVS